MPNDTPWIFNCLYVIHLDSLIISIDTFRCIFWYKFGNSTLKKKGVLQNPLSDKKGSVFYPMAEPLKNGSVQEKIVLDKKKWFLRKPFYFLQNQFFLYRTIFSCTEPFFRVLPSGKTQNPFYQKVGSTKLLFFLESTEQHLKLSI